MLLLKIFIFNFYASIIRINIFFLKKFRKSKIIFFQRVAFGDTFINYINNYHKINKENNVTIIITSELEKKLAEFFFTKNNIKETFFLIPAFVPVYPIFEILNRKRGLSSNMGYDLDNAKLIVKN